MRSKFTKKIIVFFGFLTLFLSLIGIFVYPSQAALNKGFRTPIIAFEFAKSADDIKFITGNEEEPKKIRSEMRAGQKLDILFPFFYAGLIFSLIYSESKKINLLVLVGLVASSIIIPFDLYENYILDQILFRLDSLKDVSDLFPQLEVATWWKWGAIAIATFVLSLEFFIKKQWFNGLISFFAGASILCTWISGSNGYVAEIMMGFVSLFFVYFGIRSLILYRKF
ncbi:hypothetical protein [Leptospira kanakyensis]|uniref:Uncharacterized protein n=1 Tax=Leptospira kanakyensis TaxID=2484968 RepID=A0A6N4QPT6_9LEPT|nr:hypothetical protein [Leptospira kanakyensis]MCW7468498.1 hypothetical protein [Leptospira kanakyensis]TGK55567.1 hypothetical protein EHQ11_01605 [Leptospira kanakyensis]TGK61103.1 hypothetical protein EHQ16_09430 [Leptospira kanakyensis]TGK76425.1 hypothetical protein EHQ18_00220 [Leptospira kanakyensis]